MPKKEVMISGKIKSVLMKLLPETLGGEPFYNYWNQLCYHTFEKWRVERNEQGFMDLVRELRPSRMLEIGVAEGWGAERMVKAAGSLDGRDVEYYGFDLFCKCVANNFVSMPMHKIEHRLKRLRVSKVSLYAGDSLETLPHIVPTLPKMDFIYIDGGHTYEVCKSDWKNVQPLIGGDTVVVFDDYHADNYGVRKVVNEIVGCEVWPVSYHQVAVRRKET